MTMANRIQIVSVQAATVDGSVGEAAWRVVDEEADWDDVIADVHAQMQARLGSRVVWRTGPDDVADVNGLRRGTFAARPDMWDADGRLLAVRGQLRVGGVD